MKKIFAVFILSAVLMVGCGGGGGSSNPLGSVNKYNRLSNATIKNISSYKSIGVGTIGTLNKGNLRARMNGFEYATLLGLNSLDNMFELLRFTDEAGIEVENNIYVSQYIAFSDFIFCVLSEEKSPFVGGFETFTPGINVYLINKQTGRLYLLENFDYMAMCYNYYDESQGKICFLGRKIGDEASSLNIYMISFENELLKLENFVNNIDKIPNWSPEITLDRFGNLYDGNFNYVVTKNREIKPINKNNMFGIKKAMNDIVYCGDKQFDENGELVDASFIPDSSFSCNNGELGEPRDEFVVKRDGLDEFYYLTRPEGMRTGYNSYIITKISYVDSAKLEYSVVTIPLEDQSSKFVVANDKIYFLKPDELFYVSIETGKKTSLVSNYLFNSISRNSNGISFTGLDSKMNDVAGIIDFDNNVITEISEDERVYDVLYITPLK